MPAPAPTPSPKDEVLATLAASVEAAVSPGDARALEVCCQAMSDCWGEKVNQESKSSRGAV